MHFINIIEGVHARRLHYFKVIIDGNCSPEHIALGKGLGARGFVLGTAGLFGHGDYAKSMAKLRTI